MPEVHTEIEIQASAEKVWNILTDFDKFPEWNPLITRAIGKPAVGESVDINVPSGTKDMILHCTVVKADPNLELCWKYHVGLPFLFTGVHSFRIEPVSASRVRFIDREVMTGLIAFTQAKNAETTTKQEFQALDKALKARAERK
jgi:hypothetical protein